MTIAQGSQTITFANPGSRTYGTAFAPGATASSGLAVAYTSTTLTICTVSGTTVTPVGVGTCTVTASQPGDASYRAATSVTQSFTVTKAPLTVTADDKTKVYGQANPAFTASYSGLVNNDTAGALGGTLSFATAATAASGAGSYDVTPSGLTSGNYAITFVKGTLTVTKAPLTVTADDKTKVYGQANPAFTASYSGLVNNDTAGALGGTLSFATAATAASGAGSYDVTPSGLTSGNYAITFVKGTLTVTKAPLTVTVTDVGKAYSAPNPTFAVTFSGFVNGDTAAVVSGTAAFDTAATQYSPVGPYAVTATQGGLSAANYTFGPFIPGTLTIAKAATALTQVRGEVTYGDTIGSVTATLRRTDGDGGPVVGATVAFTHNGVALCGGGGQPACPQTNAKGVATLAGVAFPDGLNAGSYPNVVVAAAFAGDANHLAAADRGGPLVVARRILWVKPVDQTVKLKQPNPTSCTLQLTNGSAFVYGDDFGDLNLTNLRCVYSRNYPNSNASETVGKVYKISATGATAPTTNSATSRAPSPSSPRKGRGGGRTRAGQGRPVCPVAPGPCRPLVLDRGDHPARLIVGREFDRHPVARYEAGVRRPQLTVQGAADRAAIGQRDGEGGIRQHRADRPVQAAPDQRRRFAWAVPLARWRQLRRVRDIGDALQRHGDVAQLVAQFGRDPPGEDLPRLRQRADQRQPLRRQLQRGLPPVVRGHPARHQPPLGQLDHQTADRGDSDPERRRQLAPRHPRHPPDVVEHPQLGQREAILLPLPQSQAIELAERPPIGPREARRRVIIHAAYSTALP